MMFECLRYSDDPDCDTIGRLLYEYGEKFILSALEDGECAIAEIEASEAYQEYHIPSMIPFHDLKNAKIFMERHALVMPGLDRASLH